MRPDLRSLLRLVAVPFGVSVAFTLLRLTGELLHWSPAFWSTATGGVVPSGTSFVIGITWLPVFFGPYFAYRFWLDGEAPASPPRVLGLALLGLLIAFLTLRFLAPRLASVPQFLVAIWVAMALAAVVQLFGWPLLVRALLLYGVASRAVVALVMFLAMHGNWGTHYDYVSTPGALLLPFWPRFVLLALLPQLVFWVGFTVVLGCVGGGICALLLGKPGRRA